MFENIISYQQNYHQVLQFHSSMCIQIPMIEDHLPTNFLQASKQAKPTLPKAIEYTILACTPAYNPVIPSVCAMFLSACNTGVPLGMTPVAKRVFTTSIGVVNTDESPLATPPAIKI